MAIQYTDAERIEFLTDYLRQKEQAIADGDTEGHAALVRALEQWRIVHAADFAPTLPVAQLIFELKAKTVSHGAESGGDSINLTKAGTPAAKRPRLKYVEGTRHGYIEGVPLASEEGGFWNKDDAKFCALAWNSHDALVKALKQIAEAEPLDTDALVCDFNTLQGIAREAIKQAGVQ